jgi:hypothetical protein
MVPTPRDETGTSPITNLLLMLLGKLQQQSVPVIVSTIISTTNDLERITIMNIDTTSLSSLLETIRFAFPDAIISENNSEIEIATGLFSVGDPETPLISLAEHTLKNES